MKYLKVFTDFADKMEMLGDAERGRLFTAMLKYASTGAEPELKGNERFLWATAKSDIDRQMADYEETCERNKHNATRYHSQRVATTRSESHQDKDKDKDKDKGKPLERENKKRENPEPAVRVAAYSSIPELNIALADFISFRAEIGKPMTDRAIELLIAKLRSMTGDVQKQIEILNQSIINRWQGVFPLKQERQQQTGKGGNPFLDMINEEACND